MAAKLFRIDNAWINLGFVKKLQRWPAMEGPGWEEDERRPRLYVGLIDDGVEITERMAVKQGYKDMADCEAALIAALEAYNG